MNFVNLVWFLLGVLVGLLIAAVIFAVGAAVVYRAIKKIPDDE